MRHVHLMVEAETGEPGVAALGLVTSEGMASTEAVEAEAEALITTAGTTVVGDTMEVEVEVVIIQVRLVLGISVYL